MAGWGFRFEISGLGFRVWGFSVLNELNDWTGGE